MILPVPAFACGRAVQRIRDGHRVALAAVAPGDALACAAALALALIVASSALAQQQPQQPPADQPPIVEPPPPSPPPEDVPIPAEMLFPLSRRGDVAISPGGEFIGYVESTAQSRNLFIASERARSPVQMTSFDDARLLEWRWAENGEQVILTLGEGEGGRAQIYALELGREADLDSAGGVTFRVAPGEMIALTPGSAIDARVIAGDPWNPDEILVSVSAQPPLPSGARRVNTRTGASRLVQENSGGSTYLASGGLEIRAASRATSRAGLNSVIRDSVRETWLELGRWEWLDALTSGPVGVSGDGRTFYVADSRNRDTTALFALRVDEAGAMSYDLVAEHANADLAEVAFHQRSGHAQAAAFDWLERVWIVIDQQVRDDWAAISELADGASFSIVSRDRSDRRWVVRLEHRDRPASYMLYERRQRTASPLFSEWSGFDSDLSLETTTLTIPARDGAPMVSHLTIPQSFAGRAGPAVLIVHDGPWQRAPGGFDPLHQFFASRGFAALTVNYRGSSGFGKPFASAGHREWAGAIQNDLIDASLWLIDEGIAHPDGIAILGEGFGGYSVLTALAATPEFFAAGAAIDPIVNLADELARATGERERALFDARIAPISDANLLRAISPIHNVGDIVRPLFIARTREDSPLPFAGMEQIARDLNSRAVAVEEIDLSPGAGPRHDDRWRAIAGDLESFLRAHLPSLDGAPEGEPAEPAAPRNPLDSILDRDEFIGRERERVIDD